MGHDNLSGFAEDAAPAFALNAPGAEIRFIHLRGVQIE